MEHYILYLRQNTMAKTNKMKGMINLKKHVAILLVILLAFSFLLTACNKSTESFNGSTGSSSMQAAPHAPAAPSPSMAQAAAASYGGGVGGSGYDSGRNEAEVTFFDAPVNPDIAPQNGIDNNNFSLSTNPSSGLAEKIIYTAYAYIEAVDFDVSIARIDELLVQNGAFVENSTVGGRNYAQSYYGYQTYRSATFTIRIPKDRFDAVTKNLSIFGNVISLSTNADNITAQFMDTESRLKSYKIQEERLLAMLEKSETVADMISIEARLAEVRYSIESLTSTLRNWQNQVDYSTLTLTINEVEKFTEIVPIQRTYWQQVGDGLQSKTKAVGEFFKNFAKWIIVNLPVFIVLAVIIVIIVLIVRRNIRKGKLKRSQYPANPQYPGNYNNNPPPPTNNDNQQQPTNNDNQQQP